MNESTPQNAITGSTLPADIANTIGGGECSATEIVGLINGLTQAYESLVDFTSHVIARVAS
jgi:hypothetical protein